MGCASFSSSSSMHSPLQESVWAMTLPSMPEGFPSLTWSYPSQEALTQEVSDLLEVHHYAQVVLAYLQQEGFAGLRLGVSGVVGAGKTTLIQALLSSMQQEGASVLAEVTSPTFTRLHEYRLPDGTLALFHADLYREAPETYTSLHHQMLHTFFPQFEEACAKQVAYQAINQDVPRFESGVSFQLPWFLIEWPERLGATFAQTHLDALLTIRLTFPHGIDAPPVRVMTWYWLAH
ncbi:MAG: tRNA (adenosine(37)-N6)-threonylcarbamoyltransferase complex ATPase subunit type 1 TsaE [Vampirovibrionales bacterium]